MADSGTRRLSTLIGCSSAALLAVACSSGHGSNPSGMGGAAGLGVVASGGNAMGGSSGNGSGGLTATGGTLSLGGTLAGGSANGGSGSMTSGGVAAGGHAGGASGSASGGRASNGGISNGGISNGGISNGGISNGGISNGGISNGGISNGGSAAGGATLAFNYFIGADITDQEVAPEATRATLLSVMKSHGFNFIRLRTFVDPKASDGYDKTNGYDDIAHTVAFGKQIKAAGMGLLVDFHYSDNWADPGKQCVPIAWQSLATISELSTAVHDYTKDSISKLIAGGARPDMVQVGNETTPGMLLHRCDSSGQPTGNNPITGSTSNWANLGALLKAGVQGVKEVDPTILVSFHIDRGGDKPSDSSGAALQTSVNWITNALKYTSFDAFGESCYQRYQGDLNSASFTKTTWSNTLGGLVSKFPNLKFFAAEYGPMQREINDVVFNLANQRGIGTFNWEPTTQGDWNTGHDLLRRSGTSYTAQPDLSLYDQMKLDYVSRL